MTENRFRNILEWLGDVSETDIYEDSMNTLCFDILQGSVVREWPWTSCERKWLEARF